MVDDDSGQTDLSQVDPGLVATGAADVGIWRQQLEAMQEQVDRLVSEGRWLRGPSDLLSAAGRSRDELLHSAVLGWLLDPIGAHGLGPRLLERMLDHVGADEVGMRDLTHARVRREVPHPEGRADIVVDMPSMWLVIENKIDAVEQDDQCDRMVAAFGSGRVAHFVYLTLDGSDPESAVRTNNRWKVLSHAEVAEWLSDLTATAQPDEFLGPRAYLATLERITHVSRR